MRSTVISAGLVFLFLVQYSCTGIKNVSGTLTKSGSGSRRDYSRREHTDYTKIKTVAPPSKSDTTVLITQKSAAQPISNATQQVVSPNDSYRQDYNRIASGSGNTTLPITNAGSSNADVNERLLKQYADMDHLADLVLYELNIVERRWDLLLGKFKMASLAEREKISANLDLLNADQLKLYKAHVKIYKEGKSDWDRTKKEVESTLLSVRGISEK